MGKGYGLICNDCGSSYEVFLGCGMGFPVE